MQSLYSDAKLPAATPKCFSDKFETVTYSTNAYGKKVTSAKWGRDLRGKTLLSHGFVRSLPRSYERTKTIRFSPFWIAIQPDLPSPKKLLKIFASMPLGIRRIIGADLPIKVSDLNGILLSPKKMFKLYERFDMDSLACLLILMRLEFENEPNRRVLKSIRLRSYYQMYEQLAYAAIIKLLGTSLFKPIAFEVYRCMVSNVICPKTNELYTEALWGLNTTELINQIALITDCLKCAESKAIVSNKKERADFTYYLLCCSPSVILWQLKSGIAFSLEGMKGLDWIIDKMST